MIWESISDLYNQKPEKLTYPVDTMFIHPLLGTSDAHIMNPDLALAHLSRPVPKFSDLVRPVCLARPGGEERPTCPDSSIDRGDQVVQTKFYSPLQSSLRRTCRRTS